MKRTVLAVLVMLFLAHAVLAEGPQVSKSTLAGDGVSVVVIRVTAGSSDIYGITVDDPSGSIVDVAGPKGWCAIATDSQVYCRTIDSPLRRGRSMSLRIVTEDPGAKLSIRFRDAKTTVGGGKSI